MQIPSQPREDVAAVKRAMDLERGPLLLVGHSYGGIVITEAGNDRKVSGLIYVSAFAPDAGQTVFSLNALVPATPVNPEIRLNAGFLSLTAEGIRDDFAQDLSEKEKRILVATQGPVAAMAFELTNPFVDRSAGELAASLAHEINQPLAAMVTSAETCLRWLGKDRPDVERARKAAERIVRDGNHAGNVIRSIRMLLRKATPQLECVDVNDIIVEALDAMREVFRSQGIVPELELDLSEQVGSILGDRVQLQQVLVNLIRNAVESMSEAGAKPAVLQVQSCVDADGAVRIAISDSGAGLDPAMIARIFEPFFTTKNTGMGLGLPICRSIVEAHGGRLWAEPHAPCGCTFQFTLARSQ
jgi:signal transduction histidine kinase